MRRYGAGLDGPSRDVGIVFQDHVLFPWASILDNVLLPATCSRCQSRGAQARATVAGNDRAEGLRRPQAAYAVLAE